MCACVCAALTVKSVREIHCKSIIACVFLRVCVCVCGCYFQLEIVGIAVKKSAHSSNPALAEHETSTERRARFFRFEEDTGTQNKRERKGLVVFTKAGRGINKLTSR